MTVLPPKLRAGDMVRVIAPARSMAIIGEDVRRLATQRLGALGLSVTFGAHVEEHDNFDSSSVASRLDDLHDAYADPDVRGILTVIGGFNSNQLLEGIDYELLAANPKVLCGFSDITALQSAILARTGMVAYSGPHWSTFGMRDHAEDTLAWFRSCLMAGEAGPVPLQPATTWTDDPWFLDQDDRHPQANEGWWLLQEAEAPARGPIVGGNLCTLNLMQGTPYLPALAGAVLFLEDDLESAPHDFDRDLTSLLQQADASEIRGLVIGRFQRASGVTKDLLAAIVRTKERLEGLPVLANVDFGHTSPLMTLPLGGEIELRVHAGEAALTLLRY